jgi:hypothetical protein
MSNEQVMSGLVEPQGRGEEPLYHYTRMYLLFLQGLFAQMESGSYKWSPDQALTEITIADQVPIPRDWIEQRPVVVTMRGPARFANMTLDQMRTVDFHTGAKERTDLVACTMSINCVAKNGVEAQRIGFTIMRHLRTFKNSLQRFGGFFKIGDDLELGPQTPPGAVVANESDPEWVMVTIQSPFFFQWTEIDVPNAVLLREIEMHMKSALLPAAASSTEGRVEYRALVSPPTIRGRVIGTPTSGHLRVGNITQKVKT